MQETEKSPIHLFHNAQFRIDLVDMGDWENVHAIAVAAYAIFVYIVVQTCLFAMGGIIIFKGFPVVYPHQNGKPKDTIESRCMHAVLAHVKIMTNTRYIIHIRSATIKHIRNEKEIHLCHSNLNASVIYSKPYVIAMTKENFHFSVSFNFQLNFNFNL